MKKIALVLIPTLLLQLLALSFYLGFDYAQKHTEKTNTKTTVGYRSLDNYGDARVLWALVQDWRIRNGYKPYVEDERLCEPAGRRAAEASIEFSHRLFSNGFSNSVMRDLSYYALGENLATGNIGATDMLDGWLDSPSHRANLEDDEFTHGCIRCINSTCAHIFGAY